MEIPHFRIFDKLLVQPKIFQVDSLEEMASRGGDFEAQTLADYQRWNSRQRFWSRWENNLVFFVQKLLRKPVVTVVEVGNVIHLPQNPNLNLENFPELVLQDSGSSGLGIKVEAPRFLSESEEEYIAREALRDQSGYYNIGDLSSRGWEGKVALLNFYRQGRLQRSFLLGLDEIIEGESSSVIRPRLPADHELTYPQAA